MSVCEASGARTINLASGHGRNCLPDACAAFDVTRRHRLAPAAEDLDAGDRSLIDTCDSPLFMRLLLMHSDSIGGILCAWIPLRCRISTGSIEKLLRRWSLRTKLNWLLSKLSLRASGTYSLNRARNFVPAASRSNI